MQRAQCGEKAGAPVLSLWAILTKVSLHIESCDPTQKLSPWAFMEAPLHRHDWLNHWLLVTELHLPPLSLPWGGRDPTL